LTVTILAFIFLAMQVSKHK